MSEKIFVSIIVPAYNEEDHIAKCLDSLLSLDYPKDEYEIIVANDGSTDKTAEIVEKFPVKLINLKKVGQSKARNAGVEAAKGEILAFIDADGVMKTNNWLKLLEKYFKDPSVVLVTGLRSDYGSTFIGRGLEAINKIDLSRNKNIKKRLVKPTGGGGRMAIRRDVLERVGYFKDVIRSQDCALRNELRKSHVLEVFDPGIVLVHNADENSFKKFFRKNVYGGITTAKYHRTNRMVGFLLPFIVLFIGLSLYNEILSLWLIVLAALFGFGRFVLVPAVRNRKIIKGAITQYIVVKTVILVAQALGSLATIAIFWRRD